MERNMKHKNPDMLTDAKISMQCGPSKSELKYRLKSEKEAKAMIDDLFTNGYISYEVSDQVRGGIRLKIEYTKKLIKEAK